MHQFGARSFALGLAGLGVAMSTSSAFAYLDPGTGSMILQVLLGGVAGLALAGKLYWHKLLSLFGRGPKETAPDGHETATIEVDAPARD
jgi:hypothetical protein